jgi:hypothetical protein
MGTSRLTNVDAARGPMVRALMPPLTIALSLLTAAALVLTAAAITPPPVPAAVPAAARAADAATPSAGSSDSELLHRAPLALPPTAGAFDLARLIYAPHVAGPGRRLPGPVLLVVESGALTVHVEGFGHLSRPQQPPRTVRGAILVRAGDGLTLPTATTVAVDNAGSVPAVALAASVFPAVATTRPPGRSGPARWGLDWASGATVQPLGGVGLVKPDVEPSITIALHRLSLAPVDTVPVTATGEMVLAVEAGTLELETVAGMVWRQTPSGTNDWLELGRRVTLLPADGALVHANASVTLRNAGSGPVLALVVTIEPAQ